MGTKNFQFFVTTEELIAYLARVVNKLGIWLVLYRRGSQPELALVEPEDNISTERLSMFDCVFVCMTKPDVNEADASNIAPAKHGWLQLDLPKKDGKVLYLSELSVKTDWYDVDEKKTYENKQLLKFYNKVKKALKENLSSPVSAVNVRTGGSATYRDMAYASSAREWEEEGGELKQLGVENIRFSTGQST